MREVLHRAVVEVVPRLRRGQPGGRVAGERARRRRAGARGLLVGEAHPHRRLVVDALGVVELVLRGHLPGQAALGEHVPYQTPAHRQLRRRDRLPVQRRAGAAQPRRHLRGDLQVVAADGEQDVVAADLRRDVELPLDDPGLAGVGQGGLGLLDREPVGVEDQPRHVQARERAAGEAARQPAEIAEAVADEDHDPGRAELVHALEGVEGGGERGLLGLGRQPLQVPEHELGVHRPELDLHTVDGGRRLDEAADVELDVGQLGRGQRGPGRLPGEAFQHGQHRADRPRLEDGSAAEV